MKKIIYVLLLTVIIVGCKRVRLIPYTEIEKEVIQLAYQIENDKVYYEREGGNFLTDSNPRLKVYCTLTNTSEHDGNFVVKFKITSQGNELELSSSHFVKAGESLLFSDEKEIDFYSFDNENVEPSITSIEAPKVEVEKEVQKYREEVYYSLFE